MGIAAWQRVAWTGIGGTLAVAVPDEMRVVVGSHSGVGVFSSETGQRTLQLNDNDYAWFDQSRLAILLPDPDGSVETMTCMGIEGGVLPHTTPDGWRCEQTQEGALLVRGSEQLLIHDSEELRAMGFSPEGSVFVLATSPNLTIMRRAN